MINVSMNGDVRSLTGGLPSVFDFSSQSGILFVLRAIRAAAISPADKNKLKDLVFLYNTGGKDEGVKRKLESLLETLSVTPESVLLEVQKTTPVVASNSDVPAGSTGYAIGRRTPVFNVPTILTAPQVVPTKPKVEPLPVIEKAAPAAVVEKPVVAPKVVTTVQKITPITPAPVRETVVVQSKAEILDPAPANNIELEKKVPAPAAVIASSPVESEASDATAKRIERIRVIKSDVNARVGNPVNLVDVDNVLGREYMSSLLEAMKLLSSASVEQSTAAMNRLETAYTQVLALLQSKAQAQIESPIIPEPALTPISVSESVPDAVPSPVAEPAPQPVVVNLNVAPVADTFAVRSKVTEKVNQSPVPQSDWDQNSEVVPVVTAQTPVTVSIPVVPTAEPVVVPTVVESVRPVYTPEVTPSLSTATPLKAITDLPTADEVSALENSGHDPLYTKDIDAGLDQLLSEWSLFKKSGLFGTGPKGREHPLYLKISSLQVPLILSGRFEGSTQEIKQSITDYMNGWRYEQGIIYEANETLDQYLRRVIRHIIDLQKAKRRS